ncbi:MAG: hypothetical protein PVF47_16610, partial [Anaerolineae bacterium]
MNGTIRLLSILTVLAFVALVLPAAVAFANHNVAAETANAARYQALGVSYGLDSPAALASSLRYNALGA